MIPRRCIPSLTFSRPSRIIALSEPIVADEPGREPTPAPPPPNISHPVPRMPIIPSGQSISLDELFGVTSVTAEPPPVTSQLPLPSHAGDDDDRSAHRSHATTSSRDRDVERDAPHPVKSPDPSDLPKGLELLNSLFQRAGVKGQPGQASAVQGSPQDPAQAMPVQQPRQRRRSSTDEGYQPASYGQPLPQPAHSGAHHMNYQPQQTQHTQSRDRGNSQSRRSSGGSSHGRPADHSTQKGVNIDPAEARMGILTAINHPAASAQQIQGSPGGPPQYGGGAYRSQPQTQAQQQPPAQQTLGGYGSPQGPPPQYQSPQTASNDLTGRTPPYGPVTLSQYHEQQYQTPSYSHQGYQPQQSQGPQVDARRSPVRNPSPPKQSGGGTSGQAGSGGGGQGGGAVFAGNVWPFDNIPKRALSPLNPAAQGGGQSQRGYQQLGSHSHHQHQQYGHHVPNGRGQSVPRSAGGSQGGSVSGSGGGGSAQVYGSPGNQGFSMPYTSSQSGSQQGGVTSPSGGPQQAYPPQVNDSSRPRQGSQGSQQRVLQASTGPGGGGTSGLPGQMLSPKWAAEAVDVGLADSGIVLDGMASGGASMEKREFRDVVVHMLQVRLLLLGMTPSLTVPRSDRRTHISSTPSTLDTFADAPRTGSDRPACFTRRRSAAAQKRPGLVLLAMGRYVFLTLRSMFALCASLENLCLRASRKKMHLRIRRRDELRGACCRTYAAADDPDLPRASSPPPSTASKT